MVPWYIGTGTKIRPAKNKDIDDGKKYLLLLLSLLPHLRIIVLGGRNAQKAETLIKAAYPDITLVKMPHPSPLFVNNAPKNKFKILRPLQAVKEQLLGNKELNRRDSI